VSKYKSAVKQFGPMTVDIDDDGSVSLMDTEFPYKYWVTILSEPHKVAKHLRKIANWLDKQKEKHK